jgi:Uma2 family endonuclease
MENTLISPLERQTLNTTNGGAHEDIPIPEPDISDLVTEDDEPVDNVFSAKQQRLLIEALYSNAALWNPPDRTFIADSNVGLFSSTKEPPIVPDAFVSVDVPLEANFDFEKVRAYFAWVFGKMPEIVVEIVSNRKGGEMVRKMQDYARLHIPYYAVFDPFSLLRGDRLTLYVLHGSKYQVHGDFWIEEVGVGLRLWEGEYEGMTATWIRWSDDRGNIFPTGKEKSEQEKSRAEQEKARAEQEKTRADLAEERANRLAKQLRALGITPENEE